jgi:hypothetical protein
MTYVSAIDVNVYVRPKYAPIEDRVRSIISWSRTRLTL